MTRADAAPTLVRAAAFLRGHSDVLSGPSVRALLATQQVHDSLAAVTGRDDLLRAALVCLPHRLHVRPGADADALVRTALAVAEQGYEDEPGPRPDGGDDDDVRVPVPGAVLTVRRRQTFSLEGGDARERGPGTAAAPSLSAGEAAALLDDLIAPLARPLVSDGATPERRARSSASDRLAPARRRAGDRTIDLSVRATVRAAARSGRPPAQELRTQARRPTATLDVVLALDVSGSMLGARTRGLAQALAHALARSGHRVALLAFSSAVTVVCPLTRDPRRMLSAAAEIEPADPTNLELVIDDARELLLRHSRPSRSRRLLLVTDAHPTVCGRREEGAAFDARLPFAAISRAAPGAPGQPFGAGVARQAALRAAARCRREGIGVSVLCPAADPAGGGEADLAFAARLARAGGGRARRAPGAL
ncbi:VWA domain-containing protein [Capillimicrobium parvum]|uniref:VWFA domain-containing protein n=1 Tax=Capillimicrobium parvum TaxID=2884022 RepID=A0A9E6XWB2_9ACTN|nr:VWA domain-containing protein [Capillimicrobium parvum]UGS34911.1 hypothetical protein DSM104329_01293 [Capillimicrobium parvum]